MPICMGVMCERCGTVYFIASSGRSTHLTYNRARGEFKVICDPPCGAITFFQKGMLKAYSISVERSKRGHASIRECQELGLRGPADHARSWWQAGN